MISLCLTVSAICLLLAGALRWFQRPLPSVNSRVISHAIPIPTEPAPAPKRETVYYRTKDGRTDYGFSFEPLSTGNYRIYIVMQPDYGSRDERSEFTHRRRDGDRRYVCWEGSLTSETDARKVAALWAECTEKYIHTGEGF